MHVSRKVSAVGVAAGVLAVLPAVPSAAAPAVSVPQTAAAAATDRGDVVIRKTCKGKWQGDARFKGDQNRGVSIVLGKASWSGRDQYVLKAAKAFRGRSSADSMSFTVKRAGNSTYVYAVTPESERTVKTVVWYPDVAVTSGDRVSYRVNVRLGGGAYWAECKLSFRIP